jgi:hypothetical protein
LKNDSAALWRLAGAEEAGAGVAGAQSLRSGRGRSRSNLPAGRRSPPGDPGRRATCERALSKPGPVEAGLLEAAAFAMRTQLLRRDLQQQRHVALHQLGQGGGDLHRRDVLLALVALDQVAEHRQFRAFQRGGDAAEELRHALLVHRLDAGQLHLLDRLAGGPLDRAQHAAFARGDEQDRLALAARAAGAADAVDVALGVVGDVEVEHVADALDIEAARGHVGGDQHVDAAVLELGDGALARLLVHVAIDGGGGNAARGQLVGQFLGAELGTREHDHRVVGFGSRMRVIASSLCTPLTAQ